jgi:hypothetical protein
MHPGARDASSTGASAADLTSMGFTLTSVRVLEVLLWTDVEERGYYR